MSWSITAGLFGLSVGWLRARGRATSYGHSTLRLSARKAYRFFLIDGNHRSLALRALLDPSRDGAVVHEAVALHSCGVPSRKRFPQAVSSRGLALEHVLAGFPPRRLPRSPIAIANKRARTKLSSTPAREPFSLRQSVRLADFGLDVIGRVSASQTRRLAVQT